MAGSMYVCDHAASVMLVLQVHLPFAPYLLRHHDAHRREEDDRKECSDSQWQALRAPVQGHEDNDEATFCFLNHDQRAGYQVSK